MTGVRLPRAPGYVVLGAVGLLALLLSLLLVKEPLVAVAAVGVLLLTATFGMEGLIVVSVLGACGLLPFVGANDFVTDDVKVFALLFLVALGAMLVIYSTRALLRKPRWPVPVNVLSVGLVVLLAYIVMVALASSPTEVPALTTPFFILPMMALGTIVWLSHEDALAGLRRALPLVIAIGVSWALAYDAGAAGCGTCQDWVSTSQTNAGLLGGDSRLYTAGQNSFLALFLIAVAFSMVRTNLLSLSLVALGAVTIALMGSRAQYVAVLFGVALLLIWKLGQLRVGGRVVLVSVAILALIAIASSPAGERAATVYTDFQQGTGTGAYRIELVEKTADEWTVFGQGFSTATLEAGYDVDLGLPNTLLVLGYIGAVIQLILVGAGIWRGIAARTLVGTTIAAILVMVLVARPTLPLLEYGHSAVMYGAVLGFAAVLALHRARRPGPSAPP